MAKNVSVCVTQEKDPKKILDVSERTVRAKFLTALFGKKMKVLVVSPSNAVNTITISEN